MSFPDFLKVMHAHSQKEHLPKEVVEAFRAADPGKKGMIPASQLRHMLLHWGEQLSAKEGKCLRMYSDKDTHVHVWELALTLMIDL